MNIFHKIIAFKLGRHRPDCSCIFGLFLPLLVISSLILPGAANAEDNRTGKPEKVLVAVGLLDLDAVSSVDQSFTVNLGLRFRWRDPLLAHDGDGNLRRHLNDISAPRFLLINEQKTWSTMLDVVDISPDGEAIFRMRLWGNFSQPLNLQDFPFDDHEFSIPVLAIGQDGTPVTLESDPEAKSYIADILSVPDWKITEWSAGQAHIELTREVAGAGYVFRFHAERIYTHYVVKFLIPLILIVMMSWVVFWIDPEEAGSQLSVAVTAALTLIAYHIALAGKLPDIPYLTRMDLFLFGSTLLVFSALLEVVITSRLARRGSTPLARRLDVVCRVVFPAVYLLLAGWSLGVPDIVV
jgi:hypothetical protein